MSKTSEKKLQEFFSKAKRGKEWSEENPRGKTSLSIFPELIS